MKIRPYILLGAMFLLFVLTTRASIQEGFNTEKKRLVLLLRGEAFRKGGQGTRVIGAEDIYDEQMAACKTHIDLIKSIESKGYAVEVFIDTYSTQYDRELKEVYGTESYVKDARFHTTRLGSQSLLLKDGVEMIGDALSGADALLILRLDMYLKPPFMELYDPAAPLIQFFSICAHEWRKTPRGNPRVNEVMFHFSAETFSKIPMLYAQSVVSWHDLLDVESLVYGTDYSLLTTKYYDSDTGKDLNPYYRIVGRDESPLWRSEGKEFPRDQ